MQPNTQVLGTPLKIIFRKTFDPWANAHALMLSGKQDTISGSQCGPAPSGSVCRRVSKPNVHSGCVCDMVFQMIFSFSFRLFCISQISYQEHA